MDRTKARETRDRFEREVEALAAKLGMTIEVDPRSRYDTGAGTVSFKVTLTEKGGRGKAETDWDRYAPLLGVPVEWLGATFRDDDGNVLTVVGLNRRAKKYPVQLQRADGKRFKAPVGYVRALEAIDAKEAS